MVLDLCETTDDADQYDVVSQTEFLPKYLPSRCCIFKDVQIQPEWYYLELPIPANPKHFADLILLLMTDDQQAICGDTGQHLLNEDEEPRLQWTIIAVKDVTVILVHKLALTRLPDQGARRGPTIKKAGDASNGAGFGGVCVNNIRTFASKQTEQFPDCHHILRRDLATHLADVMRRDAQLVSEVAHVFFAFRNSSGNKESF